MSVVVESESNVTIVMYRVIVNMAQVVSSCCTNYENCYIELLLGIAEIYNTSLVVVLVM